MSYKIYDMCFSKVYPMLVAKAERKDRSRAEVDQVTTWLTGYSSTAIGFNGAVSQVDHMGLTIKRRTWLIKTNMPITSNT